ncbi:hypothetical protein D7B24_005128 [Verticillium nonalfalfae]|uniref:alpha-1,2-Mannosidase n=1 Tax=Verticillium nonalfalfae TaxID=1051616 RepID=A0A3M9YDI5_9PEZI|nr:uncharacterized protein D7B24_005128 [Verticillium nonalfalfae]RNJ58171.1 hypothetical protein D7B24_005128 [Verticillium nonalfalfae]
MITLRRSSRRPILLCISLILLLFWHFGLPPSVRRQPKPIPDTQGVLYRRSSFDWANLRRQYPRDKLLRLPKGDPITFPRVQRDPSQSSSPATAVEVIQSRRNAVLNAFRRSWASYQKHAWTWDELMPVSGQGKNPFGGFAASIVDSLDTLWIMGLRREFDQAVQAVALIDWDNTTMTSINMFETTIRHLGGLLSAYDLSSEPVLLAKATELGDMLYAGFDTENGMPPFWFKFSAAKYGHQVGGDRDSSASGCSMSMEFTRLSQITGDPKYYDATERVKQFLRDTQQDTLIPGMWPAFLNYRKMLATDTHFTIGGQADSLYEYLPKMHALLGGRDPQYAKMAEEALDTVSKNLVFRPLIPDNADILFIGDTNAHKTRANEHVPEMQHLSCFAGGMYALASRLLNRPDYMSIAEKITRGCVWSYKAFPTGLMAEISSHISCAQLTTPPNTDLQAACEWSEKAWKLQTFSRGVQDTMPMGFRSVRDPHYLLRPEAIESVFYMWRITGAVEWRDAAWDMFQAIVNATETKLAYSAIRTVIVPKGGETEKTDSMESFWFSETLKYFYLIFSDDDVLSLDEWVLNTEAHPFKRPRPGSA